MLNPFQDIKRVFDAEVNKARVASRRATTQAMGWFVVIGLGLMGVAMLLLAAFLALSDAYGHIVAALIIGGVILVIAVLVALFVVGPLRSRRAEMEARAEAEMARADVASDLSQVMALMEGFGLGRGRSGSTGTGRLLIVAAVGLGLGLISRKLNRKPKSD